MTYGKLVPLALALGVCGLVMATPTATQAAPLASGLSGLANAQPDFVVQVQRGRRGGARVGRGGGGRVGRRGGGGFGRAVGTGLAIGILGAATGAIIESETRRRGPRCWVETNPYTGEGYWARC